jgi:hypothetical protein
MGSISLIGAVAADLRGVRSRIRRAFPDRRRRLLDLKVRAPPPKREPMGAPA